MNRRNSPVYLAALAASAVAAAAVVSIALPNRAARAATRPNIVFILADDLGYGDLGCYGQQRIQTPCIDRLAAAGVRFTQCYAGSTVCAPSRCALMTGLHTGHARVRGNGQVPLVPDDVTIAEVLKGAGYATGIVGKWGLGEPESTGVPGAQGFDESFGYLNQHHAHNYYPDYLWRDGRRVPIEGNVVAGGVATTKALYSHDLFVAEALRFIERHRAEPFFLYLALTIPHANNEAGPLGMEVPSDEPYHDQPWPQPQRNHAAMITRMDRDVGRILDRLDQIGLGERTIVFVTSDNGPHREGGADPKFFESSGPLRGYKRDLYEGGIRVPMIVRYSRQIAPGTTSDFVWAFWDVLPTLAELAGAAPPAGLDGASIVPALLGRERAGRPQPPHDPLYWEFHERGFKQAVRFGTWKAIRFAETGETELYELAADQGEAHNVAAAHPAVVAQAEQLFASARSESRDWPLELARPAKHSPQ